MRILPQRRVSLVIAAVAGGALALFVTRRLNVPFTVETLGWVVVGSAGLTLIMLMLIALQAGADSRYEQLRQWFPDAVVVQTYPSDTLEGDLSKFRLSAPLPTILVTASVVFEKHHLSVWVGGQNPRPVLYLPSIEVSQFGIGPSLSGVDRLVVGSVVDGTPVELKFGVEHIGKFRPGSQKLDQAELAELVRRVGNLRSMTGSRVVAAASTMLLSSGLSSGVSAWSARRVAQLGRFPVSAIAALLALIAGVFVGSGLHPIGAILAGFGLLLTVIGFIGTRVEKRARRRERAAGYTTLNGDELDLQQRHPYTGAILRQAGEQPLSDEKFNGLLGR